LIIKHFSYSDLYSPNINSKIGTIKSSRYRVGPISIILDFKSMIAISDYLNDRKLKLNEFKFFQRYNYFKFLYKNRINFNNFNFSKFHWVIALKDTIPSKIMKKNKNILWTLLFEDHKEKNYVKSNIFGNKKYDITFDTTQGFTPYDLFKNKFSVNFPYTFANNLISHKLNLNNKKKQQILIEIHQPKNLLFDDLSKFKIFSSSSNLKVSDHMKRLSYTKYFYCPIYKIPRWGNSIIEAAAFNCLIIGNPNCFWNSLLIQKECIARNHVEGIKIIKKFEKNKKLYKSVLYKQTYIFNLLNYHRPLDLISNIVKKNFPYKKISKFL
jgi:hypothetical protein